MAVNSQSASLPQTMNSSVSSPNPPKNSSPVAKVQGITGSGVPTPEKESAFKKWWFWLIIAGIVLIGAGVFYYLSYMRA